MYPVQNSQKELDSSQAPISPTATTFSWEIMQSILMKLVKVFPDLDKIEKKAHFFAPISNQVKTLLSDIESLPKSLHEILSNEKQAYLLRKEKEGAFPKKVDIKNNSTIATTLVEKKKFDNRLDPKVLGSKKEIEKVSPKFVEIQNFLKNTLTRENRVFDQKAFLEEYPCVSLSSETSPIKMTFFSRQLFSFLAEMEKSKESQIQKSKIKEQKLNPGFSFSKVTIHKETSPTAIKMDPRNLKTDVLKAILQAFDKLPEIRILYKSEKHLNQTKEKEEEGDSKILQVKPVLSSSEKRGEEESTLLHLKNNTLTNSQVIHLKRDELIFSQVIPYPGTFRFSYSKIKKKKKKMDLFKSFEKEDEEELDKNN